MFFCHVLDNTNKNHTNAGDWKTMRRAHHSDGMTWDPREGWAKAKVHMSLETWWDFDMLNTYCLETWQDLGPWPSASNTASKCPTNLGGFEWKITVLDSGLPALCWSKSNSSKLPLAFRNKKSKQKPWITNTKKICPKMKRTFWVPWSWGCSCPMREFRCL